jgi:hypothetical protein
VSDRTIAGVAQEEERARRPRWLKAAVAGVVAFELVAGAALLGRDRPAPRTTAASPSATPTTRPRVDGAAARTQRTVEVTRALERRAQAIRRRDRTAFARTLDAAKPGFVKHQLAMFDALAAVPLATWRYDVDPDDSRDVPGYGAEAWSPAATLRYAIKGFDDGETASEQFFTFVHRGDEWLVANDADAGRTSSKDVWDFGPVSVVTGTQSLVLGHPGHTALLRDVQRQADAAVPRVTRVWGTRWARRVVVVVPNDTKELNGLLGDDADYSRIAAVAVAELPGDTGTHPVGNRVIVNPGNFRRLGTNGRRVVLTHEVTHVATRDASTEKSPTWLVEGFADYVGYLGTGLSPRAICQELAADVRKGKAPRQLPGPKDFDGTNERLAQAYESAWLAVRLIAQRDGEGGLVRFYSTAGEHGIEAAFVSLRTTGDAFTGDWRGYVVKTLS